MTPKARKTATGRITRHSSVNLAGEFAHRRAAGRRSSGEDSGCSSCVSPEESAIGSPGPVQIERIPAGALGSGLEGIIHGPVFIKRKFPRGAVRLSPKPVLLAGRIRPGPAIRFRKIHRKSGRQIMAGKLEVRHSRKAPRPNRIVCFGISDVDKVRLRNAVGKE